MSTYNIEALLAKNDLLAFAERAGAVFRKVGGEYRSHCPIHGGKNPSAFAVWEADGKQKWKCFTRGCGVGDVVDFVMIWQQKPFKDAVLFLGGEVISDPFEMERLARERLEKAEREKVAAHAREEARRKELQSEEKHLQYHKMNDYFINEWVKRGLDEAWQNYFCLGGCPDFVIDGDYHTPTLTIPIRDEHWDVLNIKHRLLNPKTPKDKYRPERSGLGAFPYFLTFPDLGYEGDVIWVLEGEVKSMVLASINPEEKWNYLGVPGMSQYNGLVEKLKGKNVIAVADPNAECEVFKFCQSVSGRMVQLPEKIDDLVVSHGYDGDWLRSIEKQARRVKA